MPKKESKESGIDNSNLKQKLGKVIARYEWRNKRQEKVMEINKATQKKLEELLEKIPNEGKSGEYVREMKKIKKDHARAMTKLKQEGKKERLKRKKERKEKQKERKKEKRSVKKDKKDEKQRKAKQLDDSRIEELPVLKDNDMKVLNIIVDGWNITGCDKIARKCMRGKRGSGAQRIVDLVKMFLANSVYVQSGNKVNMTVHFDGKGKDVVIEEDDCRVNVLYSGKDEIVDDRLVRELGANVSDYKFKVSDDNDEKSDELLTSRPYQDTSNPNRSYLVVTSDRELTLRLNAIGVTTMKSGCFYKNYLKEFGFSEDDKSDDSSSSSKKKKKPKKEKKKKDKKERKRRKPPKDKKHWKKYVKKRFSDNSTSTGSSSSSSSSSSSDSSDDMTYDYVGPDIIA